MGGSCERRASPPAGRAAAPRPRPMRRRPCRTPLRPLGAAAPVQRPRPPRRAAGHACPSHPSLTRPVKAAPRRHVVHCSLDGQVERLERVGPVVARELGRGNVAAAHRGRVERQGWGLRREQGRRDEHQGRDDKHGGRGQAQVGGRGVEQGSQGGGGHGGRVVRGRAPGARAERAAGHCGVCCEAARSVARRGGVRPGPTPATLGPSAALQVRQRTYAALAVIGAAVEGPRAPRNARAAFWGGRGDAVRPAPAPSFAGAMSFAHCTAWWCRCAQQRPRARRPDRAMCRARPAFLRPPRLLPPCRHTPGDASRAPRHKGDRTRGQTPLVPAAPPLAPCGARSSLPWARRRPTPTSRKGPGLRRRMRL